MKKVLLSILALGLISASAYSFEWGGIFKSGTDALTSDFSFAVLNQTENLYLWGTQPLNEDGSFYVTAEAYYKNKFTFAKDYNNDANIIDVDLLKIAGDLELGKNKLAFSAGRFTVNENSSAVFAQVSDGVQVRYALPMVQFSAYAGYTGLLNANTVTMLDSSVIPYASNGGVYSLSHGFVPVFLGLDFPVLFGNQSLGVQGNAFVDLEAVDKSRYYGNLKISGPIANSVYYNATVVLGTLSFENLMAYSAFDVFIFPVSNVMIDAGVEYASGNDGIFKPFAGISSRSAYSSAFYPETSGVILVKTTAAVSLGKVFVSGAAKLAMASELSYAPKGFEADASFSYNIFSDLKISFDTTVYADFKNSAENNFTAALKVAMSF